MRSFRGVTRIPITYSVSSLQVLSLNVVSKHFDALPLDQLIPPAIGRQIIRTQLARGNLSVKLLRLAIEWNVTELPLLNMDRKGLSNEEVELLAVLGQHVEVISFNGMHEVDNEVLLSLFQNYVNLKRFQYTHSIPFGDNVAMMIVKNNPNLEHFDVAHTRVTDETLFKLGECSHLKAVDVSYNIDVTDDGLLKFCEGPSRNHIEDLRVDMCNIKDETVRHILTTCPYLKNISTNKPVYTVVTGLPRGVVHNLTYFVPCSRN